jgi:hypothetical protein
MIDKLNLDTYYPIQIWEFKEQGLYRFQPPKFSNPQSYEFFDHFIDSISNISSEEIEYVKKNWVLKNTFWCFNPRYALYLTKGIGLYFVKQLNVFPFCSYQILNFDDTNVIKGYTDILTLVIYRNYMPNTNLLYITRNYNKQIIDIVLVDPNVSNPLYDFYNFLPLPQNKNIPFYELNCGFSSFSFYVFKEKPIGLYWKNNNENFCIPSENSSDYVSIFDCINSNANKMIFKKVYLGSTSDPIDLIMKGSNPNYNIFFYFIIIFTIFLISIFVLFYIK